MNANQILFRCSSLGKIMTEPKSKSEPLSETTKTYLLEVFIEQKYKRRKEIVNDYIEKGLAMEEDAITQYALLKKEMFKKNEFTLSNGYIVGTPDTFTGAIIRDADIIIDTKCSFDIFTYYKSITSKLDKMYYWQMQGYMALTSAKEARVVFVLLNTPIGIVEKQLSRLRWDMGVINPDTDENYQKAAEEIERLAKYDDIPIAERIIEIDVPRNDDDIERIYQRVEQCRDYMNETFFRAKEIAVTQTASV